MAKQDPELLRVQMKATKQIDLGGGSHVTYEAGGLYLLNKTLAD